LKVFPLKMDGNYRQKYFKCQVFFEKKVKKLSFLTIYTKIALFILA